MDVRGQWGTRATNGLNHLMIKPRPWIPRIMLKFKGRSSAGARGASAPERQPYSTYRQIHSMATPRAPIHRITLKYQSLPSAGARGARASERPLDSTHRQVNLMQTTAVDPLNKVEIPEPCQRGCARYKGTQTVNGLNASPNQFDAIRNDR